MLNRPGGKPSKPRITPKNYGLGTRPGAKKLEPSRRLFSANRLAEASRHAPKLMAPPTAREDVEGAVFRRVAAIGAFVLATLIGGGVAINSCLKDRERTSNNIVNAYLKESIPYSDMEALSKYLDGLVKKAADTNAQAGALLPKKITIKSLSQKPFQFEKRHGVKTDLVTTVASDNLGSFHPFRVREKEFYINDNTILLPLTKTDEDPLTCLDGSEKAGGCDFYLQVGFSFDGKDMEIGSLTLLPMKGNTSQPVDRKIDVDKDKLKDALESIMSAYWNLEYGMNMLEATEKREAENAKNLDRHREPDFQAKLEHGILKIHTKRADWNGGTSWCSAWIAAPDVIGTAKHCILSKRTERMILGADRIITNGSQIARVERLYTPLHPQDYVITMSTPYDVAAIVLSTSVFDPHNILKIREAPVTTNGKYFAAHFAGYEFPQVWKIDRGGAKGAREQGEFGLCTLELDFSAQGGNSGGPIVDYNGDVFGLFALGDTTSFTPIITPKLFDDLVQQGRTRLAKLNGKK